MRSVIGERGDRAQISFDGTAGAWPMPSRDYQLCPAIPADSMRLTCPRISAYPVVGRVIRDNIFKSVVFPAPFRPINPNTSPSFTSSSTSRKAQNSQ